MCVSSYRSGWFYEHQQFASLVPDAADHRDCLRFLLHPLQRLFQESGGGWTRDGMVQAEVVQVAARVSGEVKTVHVRDNQFVKVGDPLFDLDDRPSRVASFAGRSTCARSRLLRRRP